MSMAIPKAASTLLEGNQHAVFCLAFVNFLRINEFTYSTKDRSDPDFAK